MYYNTDCVVLQVKRGVMDLRDCRKHRFALPLAYCYKKKLCLPGKKELTKTSRHKTLYDVFLTGFEPV